MCAVGMHAMKQACAADTRMFVWLTIGDEGRAGLELFVGDFPAAVSHSESSDSTPRD